MTSCILCKSDNVSHFHHRRGTDYLRCSRCKLIFVQPGQRLDPKEEKSRYDLHENDPADLQYRRFLNQLFEPLEKKLQLNSLGLDFGSGPGPTLSVMFEEKGHRMNIYDPFYTDDKSVLELTYDFITTTETAEHLFYPEKEFNMLWSILKPGGFLGIMTKLVPNHDKFHDWHYMKDDTHVTFYSKDTFEWLAGSWSAGLDFYGDRTIIFQKPDSSSSPVSE
jgi:SAM-dependent methyltransferase